MTPAEAILELETVLDDMGRDGDLCLRIAGTGVDVPIEKIVPVEMGESVSLVVTLRDS